MVVAIDILVFIVQLIRVSAHDSFLEALPLDEWKQGLGDYPARTLSHHLFLTCPSLFFSTMKVVLSQQEEVLPCLPALTSLTRGFC